MHERTVDRGLELGPQVSSQSGQTGVVKEEEWCRGCGGQCWYSSSEVSVTGSRLSELEVVRVRGPGGSFPWCCP